MHVPEYNNIIYSIYSIVPPTCIKVDTDASQKQYNIYPVGRGHPPVYNLTCVSPAVRVLRYLLFRRRTENYNPPRPPTPSLTT